MPPLALVPTSRLRFKPFLASRRTLVSRIGTPSSEFSAIWRARPICGYRMELWRKIWLDMQMLMGVWQRIGTLSLGMHSCFLVVPFRGVLNGRKSFLSPLWRANTLPLLMRQRKPFGFVPSFPNFSLGSLTRRLSSRTISPPSHSPKITNITLVPSTSISASILFATSSKTAWFILFTAPRTTWLPTRSRKPFHPLRSSTSCPSSDFPHLEGECWNNKVTTSSPSPFLRTIILPTIEFPFSHALPYFIFLITRDTYLARIQM